MSSRKYQDCRRGYDGLARRISEANKKISGVTWRGTEWQSPFSWREGLRLSQQLPFFAWPGGQ